MGAFRSAFQNWLFSAVKSKGAVSPLIRAMRQQNAREDACHGRSVDDKNDHFPARRAQSRRRLPQSGPEPASSMSSVVRTTTGITISDKGKRACPTGKMPDPGHVDGVNEKPDNDRGRAEQDVVDKASNARQAIRFVRIRRDRWPPGCPRESRSALQPLP